MRRAMRACAVRTHNNRQCARGGQAALEALFRALARCAVSTGWSPAARGRSGEHAGARNQPLQPSPASRARPGPPQVPRAPAKNTRHSARAPRTSFSPRRDAARCCLPAHGARQAAEHPTQHPDTGHTSVAALASMATAAETDEASGKGGVRSGPAVACRGERVGVRLLGASGCASAPQGDGRGQCTRGAPAPMCDTGCSGGGGVRRGLARAGCDPTGAGPTCCSGQSTHSAKDAVPPRFALARTAAASTGVRLCSRPRGPVTLGEPITRAAGHGASAGPRLVLPMVCVRLHSHQLRATGACGAPRRLPRRPTPR